MATDRKRFAAIETTLLREDWPDDLKLTLVLLTLHMSDRWAAEKLTAEQGATCRLSMGDALNATSTTSLEAARDRLHRLAEIVSMRITERGTWTIVHWPKLAVTQGWHEIDKRRDSASARNPSGQDARRLPVDCPSIALALPVDCPSFAPPQPQPQPHPQPHPQPQPKISESEGECRGGDASADAAASPEPPLIVEVMPPEADHEPPERSAASPPLQLASEPLLEPPALATGPPPAQRRSRAQPKTPAPDGLSREQRNAVARWVLASEDAAIRAQLGSLDAQIDACLDFHRAKGNKHADWVATVRTWLRKSPTFDAPRGASTRFETPGERAFRGRVEEAQGALELLRASRADERSRAAEKAQRRAIHEAAYAQRALPESL